MAQIPLRWRCRECGWNGDDADLLRAQSPFDPNDTIVGCPWCKCVADMENTCDEPGCDREATCGFPTVGGYRRTCGYHMRLAQRRMEEKE